MGASSTGQPPPSARRWNVALVTGPLGVVDAATVRLLSALRERYGGVVAAPTEATLAPAVRVEQLLWALRQMADVGWAGDDIAELPPRYEVVATSTFPRLCAATRPGEDDELPAGYAVEDLLRRRPAPLVLVTGCFDLIHAGHLGLIAAANRFGDHPVVAALTTTGIRAQAKSVHGGRPVWSMNDRLTVLASLRLRPRVVFFDGPDCLELIDVLRPDIFVKSQRDRGRPIVEAEAELAASFGGRVVWVAGEHDGHSSSAIVARMTRGNDRDPTASP
jgi:cytidyltransferase-like protein